ncbi:MAG TPA: DUF1289 domain-containing protein [Caulobacterales bacterium]|nr:DUF1289 domain-containing protein [Caulobacterales bacterium]
MPPAVGTDAASTRFHRAYRYTIICIESQRRFIVFRCVLIVAVAALAHGGLGHSVSMPTVSSPCVKTCAVDGRTGLCVGCGRTLKEIAAWSSLSEAERLRIMAELPRRTLGGRPCGA